MPKVTIWIRKEDEPKWKAIKDRPIFIHDILNPPMKKDSVIIKDYSPVKSIKKRGKLYD